MYQRSTRRVPRRHLPPPHPLKPRPDQGGQLRPAHLPVILCQGRTGQPVLTPARRGARDDQRPAQAERRSALHQLDHALHTLLPVRIMFEHFSADDRVKLPPRLVLMHQTDYVHARPRPPIETHVPRAANSPRPTRSRCMSRTPGRCHIRTLQGTAVVVPPTNL